jgi:hypothetical protein
MFAPLHRQLSLGLLATVLLTAAPRAARATPRPLPFTYIYETLPAGSAEIELYTDLVPLHVSDDLTGNPAWTLGAQFQTEIEYGITDRLELGLYLDFAPTNPAFSNLPTMPEGTGIKQRLRYRFADAGQWPVDLAVYGELVELTNLFEIEAKVILQRRLGPFRFAANLWFEREYAYSGENEWEFNPAAGVVLEKWINVQPGIEYWMRSEFDDDAFDSDHFLGPTCMLQFGKIWWSTGAYVHLNKVHAPAPVPGVAGEPFDGPVWFRTIVGISY